MKAEHRHELQTNQLAEWLDKKIEQIKPYTQAIIGVIVAAAVLFGVYLYLKQMDRNAAQAASDELISALDNRVEPLKALQATIENHPDTQQATVAQLLMAEQLLREGTEQLFTNKPEGTKSLGKSADAFLAVEASAKDPMLRAWALYGLGRAHESLGDLDRARGDFEKLLKDYGDGALAGLAKQHIQNLGKQSTKEFYDWFAKQDPRPLAMDREPGKPGQKPVFDFSDPTSIPSGDVKLPNFDSPLAPSAPSPDAGPAGPADPTVPPAPSDPGAAVPPSGDVPAATPPAATPPAPSQPDAEPSPAPSEPAAPAK